MTRPPDTKQAGRAGNTAEPVDLLGGEPDSYLTDLERATIGALLLTTCSVRTDILSTLADDDFADPRCRFVAGVVRAMVSAGAPIDVLTVSACVASRALLSPGPRRVLASDLHALAADAPVPASGAWYARAVLEAAVRRQVRAAGLRVISAADGDVDDLRATVVQEFLAIMEFVGRVITTVAEP